MRSGAWFFISEMSNAIVAEDQLKAVYEVKLPFGDTFGCMG